MKPKRERKVYYLSYVTQTSTVTYPMIRLAGRFLGVLGFQIGDDIEVVYEPGKITITRQPQLPFPESHQSESVVPSRNETLPLSQSLGGKP